MPDPQPLELPPGWRPNPGHIPEEAVGKRVLVKLGNGRLCGAAPVNATAPIGWAANSARWTLTGSPYDISWYRVL